MKQCVTVPAAALVFCAIGFADSSAQKSDCSLQAADSAYLAAGPVYRGCAVDKKVRLQTRPRFDPPMSLPNKPCLSAVFEFVVDTLGKPEYATVRLVRANDDQFAQAAQHAIHGIVFRPAIKDGAKVRQIHEFKTAMTIKQVGRHTPSRPGCL